MKYDVKAFVETKLDQLSQQVTTLKGTPKLATILVGNRSDSTVYVRNKSRVISRCGMESETINIPDGTPVEELKQLIEKLNNDNTVNGILLQLPLNREHYSKQDEDMLIESIHHLKDVDGLTSVNQAKLFRGEAEHTFLQPCTPLGIIALLKYHYGSLRAKDVTVVGRSQLLGNSLSQMLMRENANVTMLHSKSGSIPKHLARNKCDILCLCTGQYKLVNAFDVQNVSFIVDAGINYDKNGLCGDLDKDSYELIDTYKYFEVYYTPVPGGVGILTTCMLAYNLSKAFTLQNH